MINIKICGLKRIEDIECVNKFKPEYIGFVFAKSRRQISYDMAVYLKKSLSDDIKTVGVFVNHEVDDIISLMNEGIIDIAQLHGDEEEDSIIKIKNKTNKKVIKAISVYSLEDILKWKDSKVDFLLLDNGSGGTGESFDWEVLDKLSTIEFNKPYFIAGGLNKENVKDVLKYKPYAVDVSGGVESDGLKDEVKINEFINTVRTNRI